MAKCKVCGGSGGYNVAIDYSGKHEREYGNIYMSCYNCKRPTKYAPDPDRLAAWVAWALWGLVTLLSVLYLVFGGW